MPKQEAEASIEMLDYAVFYFHRMNNKVMAAACRLLRRLWTIRFNSPAQDLDEARKDFALIRKACPGMMVYETSLSILGAIERESGNFRLAERCLLSSIKAAKTKKGYQVLCGACFHITRLYYDNGNTELGNRYLKQAMELAAGNRYFMFQDIHIPTLTEMALRSILYGYCPAFAEELLGRYFCSDIVMYLKEKIRTVDESSITQFVYGFVSSYKAGKNEQLYLVRAILFGKPEISVNGVKIADTEWKTKKIKGLLEYLILCSGKTVSKETLTGIFWPESDPDSSKVSLRTALYQLRKTLFKYKVVVMGNNSFICETLEGLQIKRNEVLELDFHEFLHKKRRVASSRACSQERPVNRAI